MIVNPWHKLHPEEYDLADAEACGAIAGHLAGVGEPFAWTSAVVEAVRRATATAFDHGFETARREDHDCAMKREAEAQGYGRYLPDRREDTQGE